MKRLFIRFSITFTLSSMLTFLIGSLAIRFEQFELASPPVIFLGTFLISILITISLSIYKATWGNGLFNVILAYFLTAPVPFILQFMYRNLLFRFIRGIYVLLGIYVFFYSLFVLFHHVKNKQSQTDLNHLLGKKKKDFNDESSV